MSLISEIARFGTDTICCEDKLTEWVTKTADALFLHNVRPAIGSVVYCNLALVAEHTGIYVGRGKIVQLNGKGKVELVTARKFCDRLDGINPSFTIFCPVDKNGKAIGNRQAAIRALEQVNKYEGYNLALHNCHCFTYSCLTGTEGYCPSFTLLEATLREQYGMRNWRATVLNQ